MPACREEIARHARMADELRLPSFQWYTPLWAATEAALDGRWAEAERLRLEAQEAGERAGDRNAGLFSAMVEQIMQAQRGEVEQTDFAFIEDKIANSAAGPAYRSALRLDPGRPRPPGRGARPPRRRGSRRRRSRSTPTGCRPTPRSRRGSASSATRPTPSSSTTACSPTPAARRRPAARSSATARSTATSAGSPPCSAAATRRSPTCARPTTTTRARLHGLAPARPAPPARPRARRRAGRGGRRHRRSTGPAAAGLRGSLEVRNERRPPWLVCNHATSTPPTSPERPTRRRSTSCGWVRRPQRASPSSRAGAGPSASSRSPGPTAASSATSASSTPAA